MKTASSVQGTELSKLNAYQWSPTLPNPSNMQTVLIKKQKIYIVSPTFWVLTFIYFIY